MAVTAQMKRGRPIRLCGLGASLRDGVRETLPPYSIPGFDTLPCELRAHSKVTFAASAAHVWEWLAMTNHGAEDMAVRLYLEDGAGKVYDWGEWGSFNATTPLMSLPSDDEGSRD